MADNRQAIIESIDRLQEILEEMEQEQQFQEGEMVNFTHEGQQGVAVIEAITEQGYTIRVMAVAGDSYEPTDDVYVVSSDALSPTVNDSGDTAAENDVEAEEESETDADDKDEEEEDEDDLQKSLYVQWDSAHGMATGRISDLTCDKTIVIPETGDEIENPEGKRHALVEVYVDRDGYEPTGVHVALPTKNLQAVDPIEPKPLRLMVKMRKYELENDEEQKFGYFKGLGSAYGKVDLGGDSVAKGAYTQTIMHNDGKVQLMFDHGWKVGEVAGIAYLEDTEEGLMVEGKMPLDIPAVKAGYDMIKFMQSEGKPLGLSIGYFPVKSEPGPNGTRVLKEIALEEMSVTPWPMDTHARIRDAKHRKILYNSKRRGWQTVNHNKTDAPTGNQDVRDEYNLLASSLKEIATYMENNHG